MSDAPFLIASTMTLLTNRTIGASSMSEVVTSDADFLVAARDLEVLEVEAAVVVAQVRHRRVDGLDGAPDACVELVLLDHDGFDS